LCSSFDAILENNGIGQRGFQGIDAKAGGNAIIFDLFTVDLQVAVFIIETCLQVAELYAGIVKGLFLGDFESDGSSFRAGNIVSLARIFILGGYAVPVLIAIVRYERIFLFVGQREAKAQGLGQIKIAFVVLNILEGDGVVVQDQLGAGGEQGGLHAVGGAEGIIQVSA